MIGPTGAVRVMMATQPVDFRKGADGLAALVRDTMGADPFSGAVYVFRAKRADRVKLVFWDGTGVVLVAKRLEEGAFRWPRLENGVVRLTAAQLSALLEGFVWTPPAGQERSAVDVTPGRVQVCVRPVRAATAAGPDGLSAAQRVPFGFRAYRRMPSHRVCLRPSVRLAVHQPPSPCPHEGDARRRQAPVDGWNVMLPARSAHDRHRRGPAAPR